MQYPTLVYGLLLWQDTTYVEISEAFWFGFFFYIKFAVTLFYIQFGCLF